MSISTNENRVLDAATGMAARRGGVIAGPAEFVECSFRSGIGIERINKVMARTVREWRAALYEPGQALLTP